MEPYYQHAGITIYHGDCREILPNLIADSLITDPPFNVGKDYGESTDDLPLGEYVEMLEAIAKWGPATQAWVTPTNRLAMFSRVLGDSVRPVVVQRGVIGPKRWGWYDQFDMILVRGKPNKYAKNHWSDIRLKGEGYFFRENTFGHPGYTPFRIMQRLAGLLTESVVIDTFLGTGTMAIAAKQIGLCAIGIELEERYCEIAAKRLSQEVLDLQEVAGGLA